jgi:hypothetical protein
MNVNAAYAMFQVYHFGYVSSALGSNIWTKEILQVNKRCVCDGAKTAPSV